MSSSLNRPLPIKGLPLACGIVLLFTTGCPSSQVRDDPEPIPEVTLLMDPEVISAEDAADGRDPDEDEFDIMTVPLWGSDELDAEIVGYAESEAAINGAADDASALFLEAMVQYQAFAAQEVAGETDAELQASLRLKIAAGQEAAGLLAALFPRAPAWSICARFMNGRLYEHLIEDIRSAPIPAEVGPEVVAVYQQMLGHQLEPMLVEASQFWVSSYELAESVGVNNVCSEAAERSLIHFGIIENTVDELSDGDQPPEVLAPPLTDEHMLQRFTSLQQRDTFGSPPQL